MASGRRWTSISGIVFAALFVAGVLLLGEQLGSAGDPDRQFVAYAGDSGNRARDIIGAYALVACGLGFIAFVARLGAALRSRDALPALLWMAFGGSIVFAALMAAAAAALSAVSWSQAISAMFDEEPHQFGPDVVRLATQLGLLSVIFAMCAAAACIAAISLVGWTARLVPAWLVWLGLLAALALLFGILFFPLAALPIWAVAISIWLLGSRPAAVPS